MTLLFEPEDLADWRLVAGATGLLGDFNRAGVLEAADVHVARRLGALGGEAGESVLLAVALAVRGVRNGSVCVDLASVREVGVADPETGQVVDLPWPEVGAWQEAVAGSPLVEQSAVRFEDGLLYLDRYHRLEQQVADDLLSRAGQGPPEVDEPALTAAVARVRTDRLSAEQEAAVVAAARQWTTVLTGGPGTGKTTTVARMLAVLVDQARARDERLSIALTAPTGKAAARLQEAVNLEAARLDEVDRDRLPHMDAMTLHRLLGWRPDNSTRFRHHRGNRLKYDVIVVDECSMVDLTLMARLLEAVRDNARLVLVGDPGQLTSVGAGAVLGDVVDGLDARGASPVVALTHNYRSTRDILALADALRARDPDAVVEVLRRPSGEILWVEDEDPMTAVRPDALAAARAVHEAAREGSPQAAVAALERHRLLCAHREGPHGVRRWNSLVEDWLAEETGQEIWSDWYPGRPFLVTTNDYALKIYNGESGVAVLTPEGTLRAWVAAADGLLDFSPGRLDAVETMHATTIHKAQGSQADAVTLLLPPEGSRLLTNELFYTAVTRARTFVRVVGPEAAVRAAVTTRAQRASGLRGRLAP